MYLLVETVFLAFHTIKLFFIVVWQLFLSMIVNFYVYNRSKGEKKWSTNTLKIKKKLTNILPSFSCVFYGAWRLAEQCVGSRCSALGRGSHGQPCTQDCAQVPNTRAASWSPSIPKINNKDLLIYDKHKVIVHEHYTIKISQTYKLYRFILYVKNRKLIMLLYG